MDIKRFTLGELRVNCYVVHDKEHAYIVDPGYASQDVINYIKENGLNVQFIYITHGHPDHIGGVDFTNQIFNVPVYAPLKDQWWIQTYAPSKDMHVTVTHWISEPFTLTFANHSLSVYDTPGHSEGSTVLHDEANRYLFAGDTLFFETIGRTDIPFADKNVLIDAIKRIYELFPDETVVYPGHGKDTTISHEKNHNPFIRKGTV